MTNVSSSMLYIGFKVVSMNVQSILESIVNTCPMTILTHCVPFIPLCEHMTTSQPKTAGSDTSSVCAFWADDNVARVSHLCVPFRRRSKTKRVAFHDACAPLFYAPLCASERKRALGSLPFAQRSIRHRDANVHHTNSTSTVHCNVVFFLCVLVL